VTLGCVERERQVEYDNQILLQKLAHIATRKTEMPQVVTLKRNPLERIRMQKEAILGRENMVRQEF
jgi:hypothetical protein